MNPAATIEPVPSTYHQCSTYSSADQFIERGIDAVLRKVDERAAATPDTGIANEHVEAPERRGGLRDGTFVRVEVAHVAENAARGSHSHRLMRLETQRNRFRFSAAHASIGSRLL